MSDFLILLNNKLKVDKIDYFLFSIANNNHFKECISINDYINTFVLIFNNNMKLVGFDINYTFDEIVLFLNEHKKRTYYFFESYSNDNIFFYKRIITSII